MEDRYLNWPEVQKITGNKSRATIWRWEGQGIFPRRHKIGPNSCAWLQSELTSWLESKRGAANGAV